MSIDPHGHHAASYEHNETVAHEHSDVNIRSILSFGVGLVGTVVVCAVIVKIVFGILEGQAQGRDPAMSPVARPAGQSPPEPVLVTNEPAALAKFRGQETKTLESYGWVDRVGGVVHVPIEEAKKLVVQHGLPARSGSADALEGTNAAALGESSGGRAIRMQSPAGAATPPPAGGPAPGAPAGEPPPGTPPVHK
jgi:hypothetical protein